MMTSLVKSKKKNKKLLCTKKWLKKSKNNKRKTEHQLSKSNLNKKQVIQIINKLRLILEWTTLTEKGLLPNSQNKIVEAAVKAELQVLKAQELVAEVQFLNHQGNKHGRCQVRKLIWIFQVFLRLRRSLVKCLFKLAVQTENKMEAE